MEIQLHTDQHKVSNESITSIDVVDCVVIILNSGKHNGMYHMAGLTAPDKINESDEFEDYYVLEDLCDEFDEYPEYVYVVSGMNSNKDLVQSISTYLQSRYCDCIFSNKSLDYVAYVIITSDGILKIEPTQF
jgi:hypothetical protein